MKKNRKKIDPYYKKLGRRKLEERLRQKEIESKGFFNKAMKFQKDITDLHENIRSYQENIKILKEELRLEEQEREAEKALNIKKIERIEELQGIINRMDKTIERMDIEAEIHLQEIERLQEETEILFEANFNSIQFEKNYTKYNLCLVGIIGFLIGVAIL